MGVVRDKHLKIKEKSVQETEELCRKEVEGGNSNESDSNEESSECLD